MNEATLLLIGLSSSAKVNRLAPLGLLKSHASKGWWTASFRFVRRPCWQCGGISDSSHAGVPNSTYLLPMGLFRNSSRTRLGSKALLYHSYLTGTPRCFGPIQVFGMFKPAVTNSATFQSITLWSRPVPIRGWESSSSLLSCHLVGRGILAYKIHAIRCP